LPSARGTDDLTSVLDLSETVGWYAYSWYEAAQEGAGAEEASVDGDASGAVLTSHL
jgi:hypothetical protein